MFKKLKPYEQAIVFVAYSLAVLASAYMLTVNYVPLKFFGIGVLLIIGTEIQKVTRSNVSG